MAEKLSRLANNVELEAEGTWLEFRGVRIKVARQSRKYSAWLSRNLAKIEGESEEATKARTQIIAEGLVRFCIKEFPSDLVLDDGSTFDPTTENLIELFSDVDRWRDLIDEVFDYSKSSDNYIDRAGKP